MLSGLRPSALDYLATAGAFFGISMPVFWLGLMLILSVAHARRTDFLPGSGTEIVTHADQLGRKLIFAWGKEVYLATSIEPVRATRVNLPSDYVNDIIVKGDRAYVLMWRSIGGGLYRNSVYRVEEDGSVRGILSLDLNNMRPRLAEKGLTYYPDLESYLRRT